MSRRDFASLIREAHAQEGSATMPRDVDLELRRRWITGARSHRFATPWIMTCAFAAGAVAAVLLSRPWTGSNSAPAGVVHANLARGSHSATVRTTLQLGRRGVAVAETGAALSWAMSVDGAARVEQTAGDVFYRVDSGERFVVSTFAGDIRVLGTCFRVEVRTMNKPKVAISGAVTGAVVTAVVLVTVYEGRVVTANPKGERVVAAGEAATMRVDAAPAPATNVGSNDVSTPSMRKAPNSSRVTSTPPAVALNATRTPPAAPPVKAPPTLDQTLTEFGRDVMSIFQKHNPTPGLRLRAALAQAGKDAVGELIKRFRAAEEPETKVTLAHALGQSEDPAALRALADLATDASAGIFDRRVAAHGLAFSDVLDQDAVLLKVAREDADSGVRANAAFGLARHGHAEGLSLYIKIIDDAFAANDQNAHAFLQGLSSLGNAALPLIRERLGRFTDATAQLMLIGMLVEARDREALPLLTRLADDSKVDRSVRNLARASIKRIGP